MNSTLKNQKLFNQQSLRCESTLTSLASRCWSAWRSSLGPVQMRTWLLIQTFAGWAIQTIQTVCQHLPLLFHPLRNRKFIIGFVLLMAGVVGFYSGLFFDSAQFNHAPCKLFGLTDQCYNFETRSGWCFMSWYIYLDAVGWGIGLIIGTVGVLFFVPQNMSFLYTPVSILHAIGWLRVLHVTFFARSYSTYHEIPAGEIWFASAVIGFGLWVSAKYFIYWENHKMRGNWQKWPAIYRSPLSAEEKDRLFAMADKEYDQVNKMI